MSVQDKDSSILTVCGGVIENPQDYPTDIYRGETVYFCTKACWRAFQSDPDRFIAGEIEHPLDDE